MKFCLKKTIALLLMAGALGACSSIPGADFLDGGGGENFAAGSPVADQLSGADRDALADAFIAAMETGQRQTWSGRRAVGEVTPGGYELANLYADPRQRIALAHGDVNLAQVVETDLGLYVLTRNSNIRKGPGTEYDIAEVLPSGEGVDVVGKVIDQNWMMIAVDERVRGYVFGNLLIKAPGTELELAGGPRRKPVLCRAFTQRVNIFSTREEWDGAACNDGTGWRLAEDPPMPEQIADDELLGL